MRSENNTPQARLIVALCVVIVAIWAMAVYETYSDSVREKYDVRVSPGAVTYGTHSSAITPVSMESVHHTSVPMISSGAVHSYARYGHAASSGAGSGYKVYTTSSATVHTVGSGGGGGVLAGNGNSSSSSRGINYGSTTVSVPVLAMTTASYTPQTTSPARRGVGPRRMPGITGDEEEGDAQYDEGKWWYWDIDAETWRTDEDPSLPVGTTRNISGYIEYWNGSKWVTMDEWLNPGVPVGDTPWHWMILMAVAYGIVKTIRRKQNAI